VSLIVQCPGCHEATPFHRLPIERCPSCQSVYPTEVRLPAERGLRHSVAPKPALLVLGTFVSGFVGGVCLLFVVLAAFNMGAYRIDTQPVSPCEFLRVGGPSFTLLGLWFGAIAFGLWRERPWARPLMLAYWPLSTALVVALDWRQADAVADGLAAAFFSLIAFAVAAWYLYGKSNVVAFFDARAEPKTLRPRPNGTRSP